MHHEVILKVQFAYDPEAKVWYVAESDVPGLVTEAASVPELIARVEAIAPELLELNAHHLPGAPQQGAREYTLRQIFDTPVHVAA